MRNSSNDLRNLRRSDMKKKSPLGLTEAFVKRLIGVLPDAYDCKHECTYGCNNLICIYGYEAEARREVRDNVLSFLKNEGLL